MMAYEVQWNGYGKLLPPALILSAEGDPLLDEAVAYGAKLGDFGIDVTVLRILASPQKTNNRIECACAHSALAAIVNFIARLEQQEALHA